MSDVGSADGQDGGGGIPAPELSVVIPTLREASAIRTTLQHLKAQSWHDRLELVIVTPSSAALGLQETELAWCRHLRISELREMPSLGAAYAAGVQEASAPLVVFAEDHSFPQPGWAQALIERHREPWAAVGPLVENTDPGGPCGDADYYIGYGRWAVVTGPGEIDDLPGHNSSYKRAVLLEYGAELGPLLDAASILHWSLRAKGHRLYLETAARTNHHKPMTLAFLAREAYHAGRLFAAARARRWSRLRRALYTAASVLIPVIRLRRVAGQMRAAGRGRLLAKLLPAMTIGLAASAAGELAGYARGAGRSPSRLFALECHWDPHRVEAISIPRQVRR
jgi:hypothetical protein